MEASGCRIVKYRNPNAEFSIYDIADIHLLNRGCSISHLKKDIEKIKADKYSLFFIGGDYADWIHPTDKRFDAESFDVDLRIVDLNQIGAIVTQRLLDYFAPIKRKCLGALIGNHEFTYMSRNSEVYIHEYLCKKLGVPNMRFSGFTDIYFVPDPNCKTVTTYFSNVPPEKFRSKLRVFIHHGMGAANTAGGKINKLQALVNMVEADLVMMGHVHEQFTKPFLKLAPNEDCSEIGQKATMGLITGSYLRTYSPGFTGYGEMKGYSPTTLGATRAVYTPATKHITVENSADNVGTSGNM